MPARILIIEDNEANLELMSYLLGAFGHSVAGARDGASGLEAARSGAPQLILCDIHLPGITGIELARRIRAEQTLNHVPLLAVTALAMVGDRETILAAGFDGYLSKPIAPESFVQEVERFLSAEQRGMAPGEHMDSPEPPAAEARSAATILAVDDLPSNLNFVTNLLRPFGYRVLTADSVASALATLRGVVPDLVLSDVQLPDGTGYEVMQAMSQDQRHCAVPVVFLSSTFVGEAEKAKALALGAANYIVRPIEPQDLLIQIEACLPRKED